MFLGPHKMKMSHYFVSLWYPLELGTFLASEDPPPTLILNVFQLKLGTFCFLTTHHPPIWKPFLFQIFIFNLICKYQLALNIISTILSAAFACLVFLKSITFASSTALVRKRVQAFFSVLQFQTMSKLSDIIHASGR